MSERNGGPAFPISTSLAWQNQGLSIRDYFAAKAFQSRLAKHNDWTLTELAEQAYSDADAMIAARGQGEA
jgi:hypothetical protein